MKSILFVAAILMIGASIYGFIDHSKAKQHKEFKTMYDETGMPEPVTKDEKAQTNIIQTGVGKANEMAPGKKKEEKPRKKKKKVREVNFKSFSRAPLREKDEVIIVPDAKELDSKEQ